MGSTCSTRRLPFGSYTERPSQAAAGFCSLHVAVAAMSTVCHSQCYNKQEAAMNEHGCLGHYHMPDDCHSGSVLADSVW